MTEKQIIQSQGGEKIMENHPKNCLAPCPKYDTDKCPAVVYEQTVHMHGFAGTMPRVT